jgi:hypothetical protein
VSNKLKFMLLVCTVPRNFPCSEISVIFIYEAKYGLYAIYVYSTVIMLVVQACVSVFFSIPYTYVCTLKEIMKY